MFAPQALLVLLWLLWPWSTIGESNQTTYLEAFQQFLFGETICPHECYLNPPYQNCSFSDLQATNENMVYVYPGKNTKCLDHRYPYRFQVYPGSTKDLVIYFQGGGGCWSRATSTLVRSCTVKPEQTEPLGIFDRDAPQNPYKSYTIVHVLYCSGDLHSGNVRKDYKHWLTGHQVEHRGAENSNAVLEWIEEQRFELDNLVIMGCSAGSMATQLYAGHILQLPTIGYQRAAVIFDGFAGIAPVTAVGESMDSYLILNHGVCNNSRVFSWNPRLLEECWEGQLTGMKMVQATLAAYPNVTFAAVNSKADMVQRGYYLLASPNWSYLSSESYYNLLMKMYAAYSTSNNFVSYVIDGTSHCSTQFRQFYFLEPTGIRVPTESETLVTKEEMLWKWISKLPLAPNVTISSQCSGNLVHIHRPYPLRLTDCPIQVVNISVTGQLIETKSQWYRKYMNNLINRFTSWWNYWFPK